jgi:hypothetical protein
MMLIFIIIHIFVVCVKSIYNIRFIRIIKCDKNLIVLTLHIRLDLSLVDDLTN